MLSEIYDCRLVGAEIGMQSTDRTVFGWKHPPDPSNRRQNQLGPSMRVGVDPVIDNSAVAQPHLF